MARTQGPGEFTEPDWTIVGQAPALLAVLDRAARVAPTRMSVLITGESGTGKELLARLIHQLGPTPTGPFVAVNCGTLPRELADSELFGHERGAFTGAGSRKTGWFEEANGGTLVLDEVGELSRELQPKLLRVLETGRVRRIGGSGEVPVSVRVIAMTLRDLPREIDRGAFRIDLYHRLAGFELELPPLRRRLEDIPLLVERFLLELQPDLGPRDIGADAVEALLCHDWPGNVRELRNVLRRAAILCPRHIDAQSLELRSSTYQLADVADRSSMGDLRLADAEDRAPAPPRVSMPRAPSPPAPARSIGDSTGDLLRLTGQTFDQMERAILAWALHRNGGSRRRAARHLAMPRSSLCDKVKRYGIA